MGNNSNESATNSKGRLSQISRNVNNGSDMSRIATNISTTRNNPNTSTNSNTSARRLNTNNANNRKRNRSVIRGFQSVGNRIQYKASKERPLRKLAGIGTGLLGAGVAMTAAGLAGITSGDPSKAAQYMITAGMGGYKLGTGIPNSITDLTSSGVEYANAFKEGYYDYDELQEKEVKKKYKELRKDYEFNRELEMSLKKQHSNADASKVIESLGEDSIRYDFNANETAAIYQRMQQGYDKEEAMRQVQFVKNYGKSTSSLNHKDDEDLQKTLVDRIRKNSSKGTDEETIKNRAIELRKNLDATSDLLY